jgi:hypothetical protein
MKILGKVFIATLLIFTFATLTDKAYAQCVTCEVEGGCFFCGPSTSGGKKCRTTECLTCNLTQTCGSGGAALEQKQTLTTPLKFNPDSIREIAATHPRFAATLADFNNNGGLTGTQAKIFWAPVKITPDDVERLLNLEQGAAAFSARINSKARSALRRGAPIIVYEITVEETPDSPRKTVRLRVVNGFKADPGYTSLEIEMYAIDGLKPDKKDWLVTK